MISNIISNSSSSQYRRRTTTSTVAQKQQNDKHEGEISIFIQVLVKYLHAKNPKVCVEAKKLILICLKQSQDDLPGYSSLSTLLLSHLRKLVGGSCWKHAEMYFVKYLCDKRGMSLFEAEKINRRVAIQAAFAFRDLRHREQNNNKKIRPCSNSYYNPQQQDESRRQKRKTKEHKTESCPILVSSNLPSSSPLSKRKRTVKFDKVVIRKYGVIVGDNPSCSCGVPIALDWKYNPVHEEIPVHEHEKCHNTRGKVNQLSADERYEMLTKNGIPISEMREAQEECERVQKERIETINTLTK